MNDKIFLINYSETRYALDYLCDEYDSRPSMFIFYKDVPFKILDFCFVEDNCNLKDGSEEVIISKVLELVDVGL